MANKPYEVGYKKPPKDKQFKKGESGNPKGRKPKVLNTKTILKEILTANIEVRIDGKLRSMTGMEAALWSIYRSTLKGNMKAAKMLLDEAEKRGIGVELRSEKAEKNVIFMLPHNFRDEPHGPVLRQDPTKPVEQWEQVDISKKNTKS